MSSGHRIEIGQDMQQGAVPMIRDAADSDAGPLSGLARRSKAHWGYDDEFMAACADELTVTPATMAEHTVRVFDSGGSVQGFYALATGGAEASVELFFVDPPAMGRGIGAALWHDLIRHAAPTAAHLRIESDPDAEGFYVRMGAVRTGTCASVSIPGRRLPLLHYDLAREVL
ncbi:MAG: GNAT family N-acetyltransferase [Alphaproteobacteria bacterium]|jgi:GNAT superfamily N-acetyltransferase